MINYNMRYRGPYEYDKFILNVFQYSNAIYDLEKELSEGDSGNTINEINKTVNDLFNQVVGVDGVSDKVYKELIMLNGE